MPEAAATPVDRLVLYDGVCGLCDGVVRFLLRRDRRRALAFAQLQGPTGRAILARHGLDGGLSTMVLVERPGRADERVRLRSDGALATLAALGGIWKLTAALRLVPAPLRDAVYRWIARKRYAWFGRFETCAAPVEGYRERFVDEEPGG